MDTVTAELARLVASSGGAVGSLARQVCAATLGLPALPAEVPADPDPGLAEFAEQFSIDVSAIDDAQRSQLLTAKGDNAFGVVVQIFVADFLPRVRAGLAALGQDASWAEPPVAWDRDSDPADVVFNGLLPAIARLRALDPLTSELVRLRGAVQHDCRLCRSLREGAALDAGGSESLYDDVVARFENSALLTERHKAALRYVDALIWSPARIGAEVAAGVVAHFPADQAVELTFDVARNASNKVAVALGADAPRVAHGTERYLIGADGQTVFG